MGITGCTKTSWVADGLQIRSIHHLFFSYLHSDAGFCRIDVDINNIACKLGRFKPYLETVNITASFLYALAHTGNFCVTGVLDGETRPDCKQASWDRKLKREVANIDAFVCR